ncbi:MAG: hypothetical protein A2289_12665 [Deltaproteobacteria bacterium RIFOXYA12_FULL_58_15]|nr:MAG: hypothetical protein A2289_12665 [Deltaproteobacteria bacterium RIFOXYA12_FULL_58_15]
MKPEANPLRLIDTPEFGPVLQEVAARRWAPERLARSADAIETKVASLAVGSAVATGSLSALTTGSAAKLGLAIVAGLSVASGVLLWKPNDGAEPTANNQFEEFRMQDIQEGEWIALPRPSTEPGELGEPRQARNHSMRLEEPIPPVPHSDLPRQLELFDDAREAANAGDFDTALNRLTTLSDTFPQSPIQVEVLLARAEYMVKAGRDEEAIRFLEAVIEDPALASKKAQLFRLVADAWLRRGQCDRAVPAYQRALGLGLLDEDSINARAGLKKCAAQP